MELTDAINILIQQMQAEEEIIGINVRFEAFLFDGAAALTKALAEKFGWLHLKPTQSFFGTQPPQMIGVYVSPTEMIQVPWGRMEVPGIEGYLETGMAKTNDGRYLFTLRGQVKRKYQQQVDEIVALTRLYLLKESIYKGKAIRLRFRDDAGESLEMPEPKFMDVSQVKAEELIFSRSVNGAIQASLFTPIERVEECRAMGIPLKRGVLLAGDYGVGKTLAAHVAASKAQANGWTFVYCETSPELADVVRFAQQYSPAVVFCEDIDRVVSGRRDLDMDDILSIVDGIESKSNELMIVLTTNEVEKIHQSMLRPGRLDAVINVTAPDAEAAGLLVKLYARGHLAPDTDLEEVGRKLQGQIPAVIRECVERAKLHALALAPRGPIFYEGDSVLSNHKDIQISTQALVEAADEMEFALDLLKPQKVDTRSSREKAAEIIVKGLREGMPTDNHGTRITHALAEPALGS